MCPVPETKGDLNGKIENKEGALPLKNDENTEEVLTKIPKKLEESHGNTEEVLTKIPKKLEEAHENNGDIPNEGAKKNECPFMAPTSKMASPFLTSKRLGKDEAKQADGVSGNEGDSDAEMATAKKQHEKIDEMIKDRSIFNTVAKVYFKDPKTNKLENRGEGKFAIVKDTAGLYKILMVRDKVMLMGCNHYIAKSCPLVRATQVPRSWIWIALDDKSDAEVNEPKTTYFATFKTEEDFEMFSKKYSEAGEANAKTVEELKKKGKTETL
ncbi:hypothetical protein PAEPH01_0794 [Pancytospora epiphaga]|nr:hypothetical protein PAEPH01_0794 [Pancytospora epiphaga]